MADDHRPNLNMATPEEIADWLMPVSPHASAWRNSVRVEDLSARYRLPMSEAAVVVRDLVEPAQPDLTAELESMADLAGAILGRPLTPHEKARLREIHEEEQ